MCEDMITRSEIYLIVFAFWFFLSVASFIDFPAKESRFRKSAEKYIEQIEAFKKKHNRYPYTLFEVFKNYDESSPVFYDLKDSTHYIISFGTMKGESKTYYSLCKEWE